MNSQFSLRWNNYINQITDAFGSLLQQEDLVDVTLSCEGKKIRAHKMLLSACSPYFHGVFKENPCQHPVIVFRNVQFADLRAIVEFIYCGEVNVAQEQLESFLTTAEMLEVKGLTDNESESEAVETRGVAQTDGENVQTNLVKENQINTLSRKQRVDTSGRSSPLAKKRKENVEKPPDKSPAPIEATTDIKEEVEDIEDVQVAATEPDVADPLSEISRLEPKSLKQGSDAELSGTSQDIVSVKIVEEPSAEQAVKENIADDPTVKGEGSTSRETPSPDVILIEPKTTSVPLKKRKNIQGEDISVEDEIPAKSVKKAPEAKCASDLAAKKMVPVAKTAAKGKIQIPKGLIVTSVEAASKVEDLFDFPSQESQVVLQDEAVAALRSEDATTPVHEEPASSAQETQVYQDIPSGQIPEREPEIAEDAAILQEQTEPDAPAEEELKEPEFDYFGCDICRTEAKPVDLERLNFNHKCPICPCACFCAHLLKRHMQLIHGWFNVQRRYTQY